jgi:hypothetical protein
MASYTDTHPGKVQLACRDCQAALSGDNVPAELVAIWHEQHDGHDTTEVR